MIDGVLTQTVEICEVCGKGPQAPSWGQCIGCGQSGTGRKWVPAKECQEYGVSMPVGYRWLRQDAE